MSNLLRFYHALPPQTRSLVATIRGYQLRRWRYSAETDALAEQALEREHWSAEQWKTYQSERLVYVLHRAATRVPYYRDYWATRRRQGDTASWEYLENWGVLEKEALRANAQAFVADDCDIRQMIHEHTSGTTGKSLNLWSSRQTAQSWYALFEARWRRWYGVSRHDRWAILGGQLVTPINQQKPPFWVWNAALNQLYMSSYHLAPQLIDAYLDALIHYRIQYVWGYSSSLYALAQEALHSGRDDLHLAVAISNAEPLFDYQRDAIARAFHCPVRETYGMSEIVTAASECEAGHLHLWPEVGVLEVTAKDQVLAPGLVGDFVATGLLNADMPLIRYRVGDSGALAVSEVCACGRTLPQLTKVEGRTDDLLYTTDGRRVGRLDPIFKKELPVREAQIIQETLSQIRVLYVPAPGYSSAAGEEIAEGIRARMGRAEVILEAVEHIPRTASGKFRAVICKLSPEEIRQIEARGDTVYPLQRRQNLTSPHRNPAP